MDKNEFLISCSQQIFSGMMANPEKNPDPEIAVSYAEELWDALEKKSIVVGSKNKKTTVAFSD